VPAEQRKLVGRPDIGERLVDGIELEPVCTEILVQHIHHAVRELVIERVIARDDGCVMTFEEFAILKEWCRVRYTEFFHFITSRDDDPVIVGKYDHRAMLQFGIDDPLARGVEVVAVDDGDRGVGVHIIGSCARRPRS
jgi:hypothetical protein